MDVGLQAQTIIRPLVQDHGPTQDVASAANKPIARRSSVQSGSNHGHEQHDKGDLRIVLIMIGLIGLGLILIPYAINLEHLISPATYKRMLFVGLVLWVLSALNWNKSGDQSDILK